MADHEPKYYECQECPYKTKKRKDLIKHQSKHTGEKPYTCGTCGKSFSAKSNCNRHELTHSTSREKRHECDICSAKFTEKGTLLNHKRLHTGDNLFICSICGAKWTSKAKHEDHMRIHTGEKPFECSVCEKAFSRKNSLKKHLECHDRWNCNVCNVSFTSYPDFDRHRNAHLADAPKFDCSVCGKKLLTESNLTVHMQIHTRGKIYCCSYCDKKFKTSFERRKHSRVHKDEIAKAEQKMPKTGDYCKCAHCGEIIEKQKTSENAITEQTGKVKKCLDCNGIFFSEKCFKLHRESHKRRTQAYECPLCGIRRRGKQGLIKHMNDLHSLEVASDVPPSGESVVVCSFCDKHFPTARSLAVHEICDHRYAEPKELTSEFESDTFEECDRSSGGYEMLMNVESIINDSETENDSEIESDTFDGDEISRRVFIKEENRAHDSTDEITNLEEMTEPAEIGSSEKAED